MTREQYDSMKARSDAHLAAIRAEPTLFRLVRACGMRLRIFAGAL